MGPVEIIGAAARGAAKFASKHVALTATAVTVVSGVSYVVYQNQNEADRANGGGAFMKQDVAVRDKRGDLSLKMQGLKEAPKANEPAKLDAKSSNDEILKKLQETTKDAGIMAEAAEQTPAQPELPPEKPYIPEQMKEDKTSTNVLDGNGSNVFKTANFASSGSGSAGSEQSNAGKAQSGNKGGKKSASGTKSVAAKAGSGAKTAATTSEAASAGKTEIAKAGGEKGKNQGGDGSTTETGKGLSSDDNNNSESKTETANSSNNRGETRPAIT